MRADHRGAAVVDLAIPPDARPGERWNYFVYGEMHRHLGSGAFSIQR